MQLKKGQNLNIGKLGKSFFPKGFYVYVGSAQKNLRQRLERHSRNAKNSSDMQQRSPTNKTPGDTATHWHIDYLLPHAKILFIDAFKASKDWECKLSRSLAELKGARIVMRGFGSSDCKCPSHLYYFPNQRLLRRDRLLNPSLSYWIYLKELTLHSE